MTDSTLNGNLTAYKIHIRPTAHRLYGYSVRMSNLSQHRQNIHQLLRILFVNGTCTTWDMAKTRYRGVKSIRNQEKIFRRLLIGRVDRGKRTDGVLDVGLVTREAGKTKPYAKYQLSLYGILYCLDALDPSKKDIDNMVSKYEAYLPKIFGKWKFLKRNLGKDAYNLRILARGLYLDNLTAIRTDNPIYEIMSFIHIKYRRNFESISKHDLAEQISYWFYTFLLYQDHGKSINKILSQDKEILEWYTDFFRQTEKYYKERLRTIKTSNISKILYP